MQLNGAWNMSVQVCVPPVCTAEAAEFGPVGPSLIYRERQQKRIWIRDRERVLAINKGREIRVHVEPGIGPGLGPLPVRSAGSRLICSNLTNVWQILSASSAANESQLPPSKQKRSLVARAKSLTRASACVSSHLLLFMIIICCSWCCFFQFYTIHTFTHALPSWTWQLVVIHDRLNVT